MMGYGAGWGWMGGFGFLAMLLFWIALVLLVVWAVRALFPSDRRSERDTALDLLRRRYAAGEITQTEFEQARRTLGGADPEVGRLETHGEARR